MSAPSADRPARLAALDVFRGVTMLFMASEVMRLAEVARRFPDNALARVTASMLDHVPWVGWTPWDLIQPSFMFMVGVALPFSMASRRAKGQTFARMLAHSVFRAFLLIALGIFLRSSGRPQTNFTFEDVLTQIGLGYVFLFLLAWTKPRAQWTAAALILVLYWGAFALYPRPPAGFDTTTVGVPADWPHHLTGFSAHWDKNTNVAARADQWFLNLFPRERPFVFNRGGYLTLNFVPSLATMILGLIAGGLLKSAAAQGEKLQRLLLYGVACVVAGTALHLLGVCPLVKRIWTPSWAVFSAGWAFLFLAAFYYVVDMKGWRAWTLPFVVVGANSIAMYVLVHVAADGIITSLETHLGKQAFEIFGPPFAPIVAGGAALLILWGLLFWMYRQRVFVRI